MVHFGPLAAEIGPVVWVWGTPANFNGFRILAALGLLHGTLVMGVSQTLRRWTEGATTYISRAAITLGIGPHSSCLVVSFSSFVFPSPNLSRRRLDVYHTSTHDVALV